MFRKKDWDSLATVIADLDKKISTMENAFNESRKQILTLTRELTSKSTIQEQLLARVDNIEKTKIKELEIEKDAVNKLEGYIKELKGTITAKEDEIERLQKELAEGASKIGRLKVEAENRDAEILDKKYKIKGYEEQVHDLSSKFSSFKGKTEPSLVLNSHIRTLLTNSNEGKILLEINKLGSGNSLTINQLSTRTGLPQIICKNAVYALQDLRITKMDSDNRKVQLI